MGKPSLPRRVIGVGLLLLLSTLLWAPDLRRAFGHPLGLTGIWFNYDAAVSHVDPPSYDAGVSVGDQLDLTRATIEQRSTFSGQATGDAGDGLNLPMLRTGQPYVAHIITFPEDQQRIDMIWLRDAVQILVMLIGALLVLRRPSPATWGLFLAIFIGCGPVNDILLFGPGWWRAIGMNLFYLVANNGVGSYGAIVFALYLLHEGPLPRWRQITQTVALTFAALTFAVSLWQANTLAFASHANGILWIAYSILIALPLFIAPVVLLATFFESAPDVRERLRWVIGGFLLSAVCNAVDQMGSSNLGIIHTSYVAHSLLEAGTYVFIAVPVAYAVLKHHIIDVNVALSRATVYTALSVFVVGLFALVDLFFTRALDQKSAGLIADIALALVLGFSFNSMHRRVDGFVDRFLFRKRHLAEEHVGGVAGAMGFAHSEALVRAMLTKEPVRAFNLAGARIVSGLADAPDDLQTLASFLESRRSAVRLTDRQWNLCGAVFEEFTPAVAIPLFSHGTVDSIVLYGLHANGTALDAEEIALLEQLGASAGSALERLEAQMLRHEIERLRGMARV